MDETNNADRAHEVERILKNHTDCNDPETDLTDLITNCLHYCDLHKIDFCTVFGRALEHHKAELIAERKQHAQNQKKRTLRVVR